MVNSPIALLPGEYVLIDCVLFSRDEYEILDSFSGTGIYRIHTSMCEIYFLTGIETINTEGYKKKVPIQKPKNSFFFFNTQIVIVNLSILEPNPEYSELLELLKPYIQDLISPETETKGLNDIISTLNESPFSESFLNSLEEPSNRNIRKQKGITLKIKDLKDRAIDVKVNPLIDIFNLKSKGILYPMENLGGISIISSDLEYSLLSESYFKSLRK